MILVSICNVVKGSYFQKPSSNKIFVRNHYDRSTKKYSISPWDDVNSEQFVNSDYRVYVTDIDDIVPSLRHAYRHPVKEDILTAYSRLKK